MDKDGSWTATVPEDVVLEEGEEITAVQTDVSGNTSDEDTETIHDTTAPDAPVIDSVEPGDTTITGTGEPGATVTITYPDGTTQEVTVDKDGNWTATVPEGIVLEEGDKVTAVQTDAVGNTGDKATETVHDTTAPDAPVINPIEPGDTTITGSGEPGATVTITYPDDTTQEVTVDKDGNWTATVPEGIVLEEGDKVTAVQTDDVGNTGDKATETVHDITPPPAPVIDPVEAGDTTITGTGEPGATVTITYPDGTTQYVEVDKEGNWTVTVPEGVTLEDGDEIIATQTDLGGNTGAPDSETVHDTTAPDAPKAEPVASEDKTITGTGEPGATVVITFPDGTTAEGTVKDDGTWTVDIPATVDLEGGEELTLTQTDEAGNKSEPATVTIKDATAPDAPVIYPIYEGDTTINGTGESGAVVTITYPNGTTQRTVVDENGNWSVKPPKPLKAGDEITAVQKDEAGNVSGPAEATVQARPAPDAPTVLPYHEGDRTINGSGEPGATITITYPDGRTQQTTVGRDGKWSVRPNANLVAGDTFMVKQTDKYGKTSESITVKVLARRQAVPQDPLVMPVLQPIFEGAHRIAGTATPKAKVFVRLPDGTEKIVITSEDGTWNVTSDLDLLPDDLVIVHTELNRNQTPAVMSQVLAKP